MEICQKKRTQTRHARYMFKMKLLKHTNVIPYVLDFNIQLQFIRLKFGMTGILLVWQW